MASVIRRFIKEERGVTAIEYALIAGLVAIAIVTSLGTLSSSLSTAFTNIAGYITVQAKSSGSGS
ncbi:Flp family type IVb pilin [Trinickia sp. EG282A]|uniref:Flp family type IVb pilin n=1 Tax=Trinickia sp. EG282A TaxID=3237013 RepID=UPI0034D1B670